MLINFLRTASVLTLLLFTGAQAMPMIVANAQLKVQQSRPATQLPVSLAVPPSAPERAASLPEISNKLIQFTINGKQIKDVSPMSAGSDAPLPEWIFGTDELKEIDVLEKQTVGNKVTLIIEMKTAMEPGKIVEDQNGEEYQLVLNGKLRLNYEWVTGEWILLNVENLTMKYRKNLTLRYRRA